MNRPTIKLLIALMIGCAAYVILVWGSMPQPVCSVIAASVGVGIAIGSFAEDLRLVGRIMYKYGAAPALAFFALTGFLVEGELWLPQLYLVGIATLTMLLAGGVAYRAPRVLHYLTHLRHKQPRSTAPARSAT